MRYAILLVLLLPALAWGAAQVDTLNPDGVGTTVNWTDAGSCSQNECVDEGWPPDDATTYRETNQDGDIDQMAVSWSPTDFDSCDSVVVLLRHFEEAGGTKEVAWGVNAGGTDSLPDTLSTSDGSWITYRGSPITTIPGDGGAWGETDITNLQLHYEAISGHTPSQGNRRSYVSAISAIVYWQDTGAAAADIPSRRARLLRTN